MNPVVLPDAVALIQSALTAAGQTQLHAEVPNPRPDEFTRLQLVGGEVLYPGRYVARVAAEDWALSKAAAHDRAQLTGAFVRAMARTAVDGKAIGRVEQAGAPSDFPDPLAHVPRFVQQFTLVISH